MITVLRDAGVPADNAFGIGSMLTVPLRNGHGELATRLLRGSSVPVRSVAVRKPTLDDVYVRLTGASLGN